MEIRKSNLKKKLSLVRVINRIERNAVKCIGSSKIYKKNNWGYKTL